MLLSLLHTLGSTLLDIAPIAVIIFGFQILVIKRPIKNLPRVLLGFAFVWLGLSFFLLGLERALFPLGELMAAQLTSDGLLPLRGDGVARHWSDFYWVYAFAFAIGASTTIAEPALIAVALKAGEISGGAIAPFTLRVVVALGMAVGITLGAWRIVVGYPLHWFIIGAYAVVILLAFTVPRMIVPLAFDSGGVTTSTLTVPIITALGLGLATAIPGRSALLDGFGMIALAALFPIIAVMSYAQLADWRDRGSRARTRAAELGEKERECASSS